MLADLSDEAIMSSQQWIASALGETSYLAIRHRHLVHREPTPSPLPPLPSSSSSSTEQSPPSKLYKRKLLEQRPKEEEEEEEEGEQEEDSVGASSAFSSFFLVDEQSASREEIRLRKMFLRLKDVLVEKERERKEEEAEERQFVEGVFQSGCDSIKTFTLCMRVAALHGHTERLKLVVSLSETHRAR